MEMEKWKHRDMETWRHGDMETWRHGYMETWRHGEKDTWRPGDMETWRHGPGDSNKKTENESPGVFPHPFTVCSSCERKFVVYPFVDEEQTEVIRLQTD